MLPHGWKANPSPRPGFTVVEASREESASPVVLAVHSSIRALHLFHTALDEAMSRGDDLAVLDFGTTSLRDELRSKPDDVDEREKTAMRALLINPHVHVIRAGPTDSDLEETVVFTESVGASLLILGADHIGATAIDEALSDRIFNGDFDLLVVTDSLEGHQES